MSMPNDAVLSPSKKLQQHPLKLDFNPKEVPGYSPGETGKHY